MGKIIELTHDDVQNELAYALICETMEGAYLDTWNIAPRSEEERIEEFLEENDALLKNQDKIPFKYISDIHYGKKTVWKNPDFEN